MRKLLTILAGSAFALTSTIGMAAPGERRFVHEGRTYVYTNTVSNGQQVIEGRRFPGNETFRLIVSGKHVSGTSRGVPVSFNVNEARGAAGGVQIAAE